MSAGPLFSNHCLNAVPWFSAQLRHHSSLVMSLFFFNIKHENASISLPSSLYLQHETTVAIASPNASSFHKMYLSIFSSLNLSEYPSRLDLPYCQYYSHFNFHRHHHYKKYKLLMKSLSFLLYSVLIPLLMMESYFYYHIHN